MKRTKNKLIVSLLIIILMFNFVSSSYVPVYAANDESQAVINTLINLLGGLIGIFTWVHRLIAMGIGLAVNILTAQIAFSEGADPSVSNTATITPREIFFNKVKLLDVNFLDTSATGTVGTIRSAVAKWYIVLRLLAISILLLILIYVGIRMAISSVASEKAVYKRALVDWIVSLALIFVLHYIIMFTVNVNSAIIKAIDTAATDTSEVSKVFTELAGTSLGIGWDAMAATVVYCMIVAQTFIFLIKYLRRMLTVGFLILISPLITITYSIDKLGDQKAQALNNWLREFILNVLIQPFHCIMYVAFIDTAFGLIVDPSKSNSAFTGISLSNGIVNSLIAILCIKFIDDGEKIVRQIFGFANASSLKPLEVAATAAALKGGTEKIASAAGNMKKGINFAKEKGVFKAASKDIAKMKGSLNAALDKRSINKRTKELMNSGKYKTERGARNRATKEVQAQRRLKDMKASNSTKRNKKIEEQMKKDYGGSQKQFEQFMAKVKSGDPKALEKYNQRFADASKKVPMSNHTGKNITGALGNAGKFFKSAMNSNTGKFIRKTMVPAGIGLALGSMAFSGTNVMGAYGIGKTAYQGAKEFQKNSTKTIATEANNYAEGKVSTKEELHRYADTVEGKGNNGAYEKGSDETKDLLRKLEQQLSQLNMDHMKDKLANDISRELLQNPSTFDLNSVLEKNLGSDAAQHAGIQEAAGNYAEHRSEGYLYDQIKHANEMGVSTETLVEKMDDEIDYSKFNMTENITVQNTNSENTRTSNTADLNIETKLDDKINTEIARVNAEATRELQTNATVIEAQLGTTIEQFAQEMMRLKENGENTIGKMNNIEIDAKNFSSAEEIVSAYKEKIKEP